MSSLPEELWSRILEIGIEKSSLSYKDLCCISISCHLLHRLSSDDSLWNRLISSDFPSSSASSLASSSSKSLYKLRLEREKERLSHMARITYHYISCHNQSFNDRLCRWSMKRKYCLQLGVKERLQKLHEGDEEARKQKRLAYP